MESDRHLVSSGLWQWATGPGLERFEMFQKRFEMSQKEEGWILRGTILTAAAHGAAEARYEVFCDGAWQTREALISVRDGRGERELVITAENGQWRENGRPNQSVTGCVDIDLGWSPSTNTLPIRRLGLEIGKATGPLTAAWVSFPDLKLQPLPQEYLRIGERQYRYSSRGGAFVAQLSVDEHGLVLDYEGFWQRVRVNR